VDSLPAYNFIGLFSSPFNAALVSGGVEISRFLATHWRGLSAPR
jgi:hypothetical protein